MPLSILNMIATKMTHALSIASGVSPRPTNLVMQVEINAFVIVYHTGPLVPVTRDSEHNPTGEMYAYKWGRGQPPITCRRARPLEQRNADNSPTT